MADAAEWSTREVCEFFKPMLTPKQLKGFEGKNLIHPSRYNKWPIPETIQAICNHWRELAEDDRMISAKARRETAKAEQEEIITEYMKDMLCDYEEMLQVSVDEVKKIQTELITNVPRVLSLLTMPESSRDREILIRDVVRKELTKISRDTPSKPRKRDSLKAEAKRRATSSNGARRVGRRKTLS